MKERSVDKKRWEKNVNALSFWTRLVLVFGLATGLLSLKRNNSQAYEVVETWIDFLNNPTGAYLTDCVDSNEFEPVVVATPVRNLELDKIEDEKQQQEITEFQKATEKQLEELGEEERGVEELARIFAVTPEYLLALYRYSLYESIDDSQTVEVITTATALHVRDHYWVDPQGSIYQLRQYLIDNHTFNDPRVQRAYRKDMLMVATGGIEPESGKVEKVRLSERVVSCQRVVTAGEQEHLANLIGVVGNITMLAGGDTTIAEQIDKREPYSRPIGGPCDLSPESELRGVGFPFATGGVMEPTLLIITPPYHPYINVRTSDGYVRNYISAKGLSNGGSSGVPLEQNGKACGYNNYGNDYRDSAGFHVFPPPTVMNELFSEASRLTEEAASNLLK